MVNLGGFRLQQMVPAASKERCKSVTTKVEIEVPFTLVIFNLRRFCREFLCGVVGGRYYPSLLASGQRRRRYQVEAGMADGGKQTLPLLGEQGEGKVPGSMVVAISAKRHDTFRRQGDDLYATLHLTLREALLGFEKSFAHMDGRDVPVVAADISQPGRVLTLVGEGMPRGHDPTDKGDLLVTLVVDMPRELDQRQRDLLAQALT